MRDRKNIVIAGGGIAGVLAATKLGRTLGRQGRARITLVDPGWAHVWKPMLHAFAAGTASSAQQKVPFVALASRHCFHYIPSALVDVDAKARMVHLSSLVSVDGERVGRLQELSYDVLVLALGSSGNDFGTEGVREHCSVIDTLPQAQDFNNQLYKRLLQSVSGDNPLSVSIVGGGATGVQLAAELSQLLQILSSYGDFGHSPRLRITLIESGPRILSAFPVNISRQAERKLESMGVEVITDAMVARADAEGFHLKDGRSIRADMRVWAAGVRAPEHVARLQDFKHARGGEIVVRPSLQTTSYDNVFALGDCASLIPEGESHPLPPTAQVARQQALHLVEHMASWLDGGEIPPFQYHDFGALVSLGRYNGYGTLGRYGMFGATFIRGYLARMGHEWLYRRHQAEINGNMRALGMFIADKVNALVRPTVRLD